MDRSPPGTPPPFAIPVAISARHVHLCRDTMERLFGRDHSLDTLKPLTQPGQFAAAETVTLRGPKGRIEGVRVLGPLRERDQIEISRSDAFQLGVNPPVRLSGDLFDSAPITLEGSGGSVELPAGAICARRHIHADPANARRLGLVDGGHVSVQVHSAERSLLFEEVIVRVDPHFSLEMHLDTDEANAAGLTGRCTGELISNPASL